jgi:4-hydroxybenzoate polyprenyltransferase
MYAIRSVLIISTLNSEPQLNSPAFPDILFYLCVLVVVLLAAGGNVINDYFDQKVDRINRPEKVIVGKLVKRRVAIIVHQVFNIVAVLLSIFLAFKSGVWWFVAIPVFTATLLWIYSPILKKKVLIGNLSVAICVAIIPWWTGVFELHYLSDQTDAMFHPRRLYGYLENWINAYTLFAFLLTLSRECIKDIEDIEGDSAEGYKTLPIVWGIGNSKFYSVVLQTLALCATVTGTWWLFSKEKISTEFLIAAAVLVLLEMITILKTYLAENKAQFHGASIWHKAVMGGGIAILFFL